MKRRGWLADLLVGGLAGGIAGVIASVNLVIFSGVPDGYEASLGDAFRHSPVVGVLALGFLVVAPVVGVVLAHRIRSGNGRRLSP